MVTQEQLAISFADVLAAEEHLTGIVNLTPVFSSRTLDGLCGREVFLKCESFQRTGAFKFRGAYNAISRLGATQRARGVVAYSSGNHAQGVALSAKLLGIPAVICMPSDAPAVKQDATRDYGAEIVFFDRQTVDPDTFQAQVARERGMTVIHPYDLPDIMAGQGTAALELMRQVPGIDALVAPVGGGGLLAGCAIAAKGLDPAITVFGVETVGADDTKRSLDCGERVTIAPPATIADGIRLVTPGDLTFPIVKALVDDVLVVSDDEVLDALRFVLQRMKLVIEPSGAVPVAALLQGHLPAGCGRVGVIISGGNIDPLLLRSLW
jgi:threo-3-hydroxy-L-aspartate ammonia-lyase